MTTEIFISAGEVSGDMHGAKLVKAINNLNPEIKVFGMGGSSLRKVGVETIVDSETEASVMGFAEVVSKLPDLLHNFNKLCSEARKRKPALAILIDFPDFNLRLAERMHAAGIPVLYYISPQVWAWRTGRIKNIKKYVTRMVPILPFEEDFYKLHGVEAKYVGHPLLDNPPAPVNRVEFLQAYNLNADKPLLALLPGSRTKEINRILPTMLEAFDIIRSKITDLQAILPVAPSLKRDFLQSFVGDRKVTLIEGKADQVMQIADATIVTSGTACLEAALAGNPFVVVYKANAFSYKLARWFVGDRIKFIALPNLIADQQVVSELLQEDANPERIAEEITTFLSDERARAAFKERIKIVRDTLEVKDGAESSSERIAKIALEMI